MMVFRQLKKNVQALLSNNAGGKFRVKGYQSQGVYAEEILGTKRTVRVFFSEDSFLEGESGLSGPYQSEVQMSIEIAVSAQAEGNLQVLNDPQATQAQISAALSATTDADEIADESFDEVAELVFQILMAAENIDVGFIKPYPVSSRWINAIRKNPPVPVGDLVVIFGAVEFKAKVKEKVAEIPGVPAGSVAVDATVEIDQDTSKQGTTTGV